MLGNSKEFPGYLLKGMAGFHINVFFALIIVIGLIVILLFLVERLKNRIPSFLKSKTTSQPLLSICDVIKLDAKRKLFAVAIENKSGKKALAVILIGGNTDSCIGWIEEDSLPANFYQEKEVNQKDSSYV